MPAPLKRRLTGKSADPTLRSKSPDPKKLKRAEKLLKKKKESAGQRPLLKDGTETPKGRVRRSLSFELDKSQTFQIDAENPAPRKSTVKAARASSEPARMSVTEADKILESMAVSVLASFDSKSQLHFEMIG